METTSPELQQVIEVIRREHRRTQLVFGISIIILAVIIMFIAPGIISLETSSRGQDQNGGNDSTTMPAGDTQTSSSMTATTSTGTSSLTH